MSAPEWLLKNVDKVIGQCARAYRSMKQLPTEIRASKEAKRCFIERMKHWKCDHSLTSSNIRQATTLFTVPIVETPSVRPNQFCVVWLDYAKLLRRADAKA